MRYSYEFKRKCVEIYRQGILPDIPDGVSKKYLEIQFENGSESKMHKNLKH